MRCATLAAVSRPRLALAALGLTLGLGVGLSRPAAAEGDLSDTLKFLGSVSPEFIEGWEEWIDPDPDEALALIMEDDEFTGLLYLERSPEKRSRGDVAIQTLGDKRLDYAQLAPIIEEAAKRTGLPAALIDAVIRTESGYRPNAVSRVGAQGLMQLMPATARDLGVTNAFDWRQNVFGGSKYLAKLYKRFKRLDWAIAAYNAGPHRVVQYKGIPPFKETRKYVQVVLQRFRESKLAKR